MRGKYIVIEGSDGTGKSSQVENLQKRLKEQGIESIQIHEPDGVPTAQELRKIIKNGTLERDAWTNVLLFTAARRLNWLQAMEPALESSEWVLAARSWISTVAYQGYGEGIPVDTIANRTRDDVGETYMHPDLALILTLNDEAVRNQRISSRGEIEHPDTFESRPQEFQRDMQTGYEQFARDNDIELIDASKSFEAVADEIWQRVTPFLR